MHYESETYPQDFNSRCTASSCGYLCVIFVESIEMTQEPRFDIFSGSIDKDALRIEAVEGLAKARERMEELAANVPGKYFVFSMVQSRCSRPNGYDKELH